MMKDPYISIKSINLCYIQALLYTCFAHTWLNIVRRAGIEKNRITTSKEVTKKLAIVTGSNTGIGFQTARRLVQEYGWDVILACRSKDKAIIARNSINDFKKDIGKNRTCGRAIVIEHVLDLSDFDSIRKYVNEVEKKFDKIDVLINNAGRNSSGRSAGNPELNLMFQSNYLGHFLLTGLLLKNKLLLSSSIDSNDGNGSKVINLSSVMHHFSKGDTIEGKGVESIASTDYWRRRAIYSEKNAPTNVYSASKLAAILHAFELNQRYSNKNLIAIAVNPGAVNSDIWRGFPRFIRRHIFDKIYLTTEDGSEPVVAAAIRDNLTVGKEKSISNDGKGFSIYIQPYADPHSIFNGQLAHATPSSSQGPMKPYTEMLGPYVGHLLTMPRLPENTEAAAKALWKVSEQMTKSQII